MGVATATIGPECKIIGNGDCPPRFAHDLPLPTVVKRPRFICSTHRAYTALTSTYSYCVTQCDPTFVKPPDAMLIGKYFILGSILVSHNFLHFVINMFLRKPNATAIASVLSSAYRDAFVNLQRSRESERIAGLKDDEEETVRDIPAKLQQLRTLRQRYLEFVTKGVTRYTIQRIWYWYWDRQGRPMFLSHLRSKNSLLPMLLSADTTYKASSHIYTSISRPPRVDSIDPWYGSENAVTTVTLRGKRLGITAQDVDKVTIRGQLCNFEWFEPSIDCTAYIVCKIPRSNPSATYMHDTSDGKGCILSVDACDVIVTTRSGGTGTCYQQFVYHKQPPGYVLDSTYKRYNKELKESRVQMTRAKVNAKISTIIDGDGYIRSANIVPQDKLSYLAASLQGIITAGADSWMQRVSNSDDKTMSISPHLKVFYVDNVHACKQGYSSFEFQQRSCQ